MTGFSYFYVTVDFIRYKISNLLTDKVCLTNNSEECVCMCECDCSTVWLRISSSPTLSISFALLQGNCKRGNIKEKVAA